MFFTRLLRSLTRDAGSALLAIFVLALGLALSGVLFRLTDSLLLASPPEVGDPQDIYGLYQVQGQDSTSGFIYPDLAEIRERSQAFLDLAISSSWSPPRPASFKGTVVPAAVDLVSENYFDVLQVRMLRGRSFVAAERDLARGGVAVLSEAFWRRSLGAAESVLGGSLVIGGHQLAVVGIAPAGFRGPAPRPAADVWVPIAMADVLMRGEGPSLLERSDTWVFWLDPPVSRPRTGVSAQAATDRLRAVAASLAEDLPASFEGAELELGPLVRPDDLGPLYTAGRLLASAAAILLGLAGLNATLLLLARAETRRRELGICYALGASRARIRCEALAESLALALLAGLLGSLAAIWAQDLVRAFSPLDIIVDASIARTIAFCLLLAAIVGGLAGLPHAMRSVRASVRASLESGRSDGRPSRLPSLLVILQLALSVVLVVGLGLLGQSFRRAATLDLGFTPEGLLAVELAPTLEDADARAAYFERMRAATAGLPGAREVAFARLPPFRGHAVSIATPSGAPERGVSVQFDVVSSRFFATLGIRLIEGRPFTDREDEGSDASMISRLAAAELWPGERALGRRFELGGRQRVVVGVVENTRTQRLKLEQTAAVYLPVVLRERSEVTLLVAAAAGSGEALVDPLRARLTELDPDLAIVRPRLVTDDVERKLRPLRVAALGFSVVALAGLLLAGVGLYGVLSRNVSFRARAVGIRMALGATPGQILRRTLASGASLCGAGLALGLVLAWWSTQLAEAVLFGVEARDPASFALAPVVLLAVTLLAAARPAWRAARIEPMRVLREE